MSAPLKFLLLLISRLSLNDAKVVKVAQLGADRDSNPGLETLIFPSLEIPYKPNKNQKQLGHHSLPFNGHSLLIWFHALYINIFKLGIFFDSQD